MTFGSKGASSFLSSICTFFVVITWECSAQAPSIENNVPYTPSQPMDQVYNCTYCGLAGHFPAFCTFRDSRASTFWSRFGGSRDNSNRIRNLMEVPIANPRNVRNLRRVETSPQNNEGPVRSRYFIGIVTNITGASGIIDGDVHFNMSSVVGRRPVLNERVVVNAIWVSSRWNGTKVRVISMNGAKCESEKPAKSIPAIPALLDRPLGKNMNIKSDPAPITTKQERGEDCTTKDSKQIEENSAKKTITAVSKEEKSTISGAAEATAKTNVSDKKLPFDGKSVQSNAEVASKSNAIGGEKRLVSILKKADSAGAVTNTNASAAYSSNKNLPFEGEFVESIAKDTSETTVAGAVKNAVDMKTSGVNEVLTDSGCKKLLTESKSVQSREEDKSKSNVIGADKTPKSILKKSSPAEAVTKTNASSGVKNLPVDSKIVQSNAEAISKTSVMGANKKEVSILKTPEIVAQNNSNSKLIGESESVQNNAEDISKNNAIATEKKLVGILKKSSSAEAVIKTNSEVAESSNKKLLVDSKIAQSNAENTSETKIADVDKTAVSNFKTSGVTEVLTKTNEPKTNIGADNKSVNDSKTLSAPKALSKTNAVDSACQTLPVVSKFGKSSAEDTSKSNGIGAHKKIVANGVAEALTKANTADSSNMDVKLPVQNNVDCKKSPVNSTLVEEDKMNNNKYVPLDGTLAVQEKLCAKNVSVDGAVHVEKFVDNHKLSLDEKLHEKDTAKVVLPKLSDEKVEKNADGAVDMEIDVVVDQEIGEVNTGKKDGGDSSSVENHCRLPPYPLDVRNLSVAALKSRYPKMPIPNELISVTACWMDLHFEDGPMSIVGSSKFHITDEDKESDSPECDANPPEDLNSSFTAKVLLVSMPPVEEICQKCVRLVEEGEAPMKNSTDPLQMIHCMLGEYTGDRSEFVAIGGHWSPSLDGKDPKSDPQVLIRTAIRQCKNMTGVDLSAVTKWYRIAEIKYYRDASERMETVVLFVPDAWHAMPSALEWDELHEEAFFRTLGEIGSKLEETFTEEDMDDDRRIHENERDAIVEKYKLPETPHILVHPSRKINGGKFNCKLASLASLLSYSQDDDKEHSFEVSFFAEAMREMIIRSFGIQIFSALRNVANEGKIIVDNGISIVEPPSVRDQGGTECEKSKSFDKRIQPIRQIHRELLLAFSYFDTSLSGNMSAADLEKLLLLLGVELTCAQAKRLVEKASRKSPFVNYRDLTDMNEESASKPSIKSTNPKLSSSNFEPVPLVLSDEVQPPAPKRMRCSIDEFDGFVLFKGALVSIDNLEKQLKRNEDARLKAEMKALDWKHDAANYKEKLESSLKDLEDVKGELVKTKGQLEKSVDQTRKEEKNSSDVYLKTLLEIQEKLVPILKDKQQASSSLSNSTATPSINRLSHAAPYHRPGPYFDQFRGRARSRRRGGRY